MFTRILFVLAVVLAPMSASAQLMSLDMGTGTRGVATGATLTDVTLSGTTTVSGASSFNGTLNMNANLITNIGHSGTDFTAGGGLTLNGALTASGGVGVVGAYQIVGTSQLEGNLTQNTGDFFLGGGAPYTGSIDTGSWGIDATGAATGFTSITASGALTSGSLSTGAVTGTTFTGTTLSVSGASTLTGAVSFGATSRFGSDLRLDFGSGADAATGSLEYDTGQTQDALFLRVPETSRTVHIGDQGDVAYDYALGAQSHPTLAIHSANQSATQYMTLAHSSTGGAISTGLGPVLFSNGSGSIAIQTIADNGGITLGGASFLCMRSTASCMRQNNGIEMIESSGVQGYWLNGSRFQTEYAAVASAGDLTLTAANVFSITGTTTINAITTTNWLAGATVTLTFEASVTVKNNTAGGASTAVMLLAGGADFSATANDVLTLLYNGTNWREVSRSVN